MITLRTFLALIFLGFFAAPLRAADAPERESLEKIIPYGITLLEAKNYRGFLEAFAKPEDLKEMLADGPIDQVAAEFGKEMGPALLGALKKIKDQKPKLDEKGLIATYTLPEPIDGETELKFQKVGKYWYIVD